MCCWNCITLYDKFRGIISSSLFDALIIVEKDIFVSFKCVFPHWILAAFLICSHTCAHTPAPTHSMCEELLPPASAAPCAARAEAAPRGCGSLCFIAVLNSSTFKKPRSFCLIASCCRKLRFLHDQAAYNVLLLHFLNSALHLQK